jgi:hypothetical protein
MLANSHFTREMSLIRGLTRKRMIRTKTAATITVI